MTEIERAQANLKVHSTEPLNAEPPLGRLVASFITPQRDLYIRTHGEVQHIDEATHRLHITGLVTQPLELSVGDLKERFPVRKVVAGLQCAGNRRADLQEVAETAGDPWSGGAVANLCWTGVSLRDVLYAAGAETGVRLHVAFQSPDEIEVEGEKALYGVSIPMPKALGGDVLLAWEINGELFPPSVSKEDVDWDAGLTIDAMPLNSAICVPERGAKLQAGRLTLRGWVIASERVVKRVDVSTDGGRRWAQAKLEQDVAPRTPGRCGAWRRSWPRASTSSWSAPSTKPCRLSRTRPIPPGTFLAISPPTCTEST